MRTEGTTTPESGTAEPTPSKLGHFAIGRLLGDGGMGVVFEARDVLLDRAVALKVLRPDVAVDAKARARLLREAQALARLRHRNVVTVFEVGAVGDDIFIAMELLEGATLRDWLREPRDWRAIVDMFAAAGRGLAAAHALGLVHRDVKPSNVFLDGDGTPKIGDFGLVAAAGDPDPREREPGDARADRPRDRSLTTTGTVVGTPAYMAPEQLHDGKADARADQYAFCVSLHEALTGVRPREPEPPDARPLPPRLRPILARGLAERPDDRFPSIDALLAALARARRGRARAWTIGGAAIAACAIAAGSWAIAGRGGDDDPCPAPAAQLDAAWGSARREALRTHVLAIDHALGAERATAATARLDRYAGAWTDMRVDACRATRVRGAQSDAVLDLRTSCLDRRLAELGEAAALVIRADSTHSLDRAIQGLDGLPLLATCADAAALSAEAPPPEQPTARAVSDVILRRIAVIGARLRADADVGLLAEAQATVASARALGHDRTLAVALRELSNVQGAVGDGHLIDTLRELTQVAARAHDYVDEAHAWSSLIGVMADEGNPSDALALVPAGEAAVLRAGDPPDLRGDLLYEQGEVKAYGPNPAEGVALLAQARALYEKMPASDQRTENIANTYLEAGIGERGADIAAARADLHHAIALFRELDGPDSTDEAKCWYDLGETYRERGEYRDAEIGYANARRIYEERVGPSADVAETLAQLATIRTEQLRFDEALVLENRVLEIYLDHPPEIRMKAAALLARATTLRFLRRLDEAGRDYDDVVALFAGKHEMNLAIAYFNRGELQETRGRCEDAIADEARAIAEIEQLAGPGSPFVAYPLIADARCKLTLGRAADAIAPLERTLTVVNDQVPGQAALAHFYHGRALVDSGRDRAGGLAEARAAHAELKGVHPDEQKAIDAWLTAHGGVPAGTAGTPARPPR